MGLKVNQIFILFKKDFKAMIYSKAMIMLLVMGPLTSSILFPIPYRTDMLRKVPIAVVDEDRTPDSEMLARMLDAAEELKVDKSYFEMSAAKQALYDKEIHGIIYIEKDFQKHILRGVPEKVKLYTDASYMSYYRPVSGGVQRIVKSLSAMIEAKRAGVAGLHAKSLVTLVNRGLYNPANAYMQYIIPGSYIGTIQQLLLSAICVTALGIRASKKKYKKIFKVWHILAAKTLTFFCVGLCYFIYLYIIVYRAYNIAGGEDILGTIFFLIPFFLSVIFLGIAVSVYFKDRETITPIFVVCALPIAFSTGRSWPQYLMPWYIKAVTFIFPNVHAYDGLVKIYIMGAGFSSALTAYACLWLLAAAYGLFAYRAIDKRYPYKM